MKKNHLLISVLVISFSFFSFAQLDSVYYQGPSQGSVTSGAIQNTDNFPLGPEIIQGGETRVIPNIDTKFNSEPSIIPVDESNLPPYVYVEDANARQNSANLFDAGGVLLNKFQGFTATNAIPPDPSMAVGPNHIVATVNGFPSQFRIFDKQGSVLKTISVSAWFAPVSPDESGDGQVMYDHFSGRWIINYMQINTGNLTAANLVAVSDDDNPLGVWYIYRLDTKKHGSIQTNTWGDYPQIGFDDQAIYITTRLFGFAGGFYGMKLRVIKKSELYSSNGGAVTWMDMWDIRRPNANPPAGEVLDGIHPTFCYTSGQGGYLFYSAYGGGNYYVLYKVSNPTSNTPGIRGKNITVQFYYGTPNAAQLGGGVALESNGSGCRTAPIIRDGKIYVAHSVGNSSSPIYASAKYVIIDLSTVTITEQAELGAVGYYYIYPTLAVDEDHNIGMTFTRSATNEYAGAFFSSRSASDPPGLNPSTPVQVGLGNYQQVADGRNRWGDYMAIYLDPSDNHDMFLHTEYATASNNWATIIGHIIAAPYSGVHIHSIPESYNFGDIEVGTTSSTATITLANFGDTDLSITNIPASFNEFNLESVLTFPITVLSYDSLTLEFSFSPTSEGTVNVVYPVTSNDPDFPGINLSGTGYDLTFASENTFYASSGIQNNGDIITIDPSTGIGTLVGSSTYSEITSISINPLDGRIYGVIAGSSSADIVKINAAEGDAHEVFSLNIPLMAGIAFDTTGTLYGVTRTGEIYTIDEITGDYDFVVDAVASYLGVTFHPETNELWASSRAVAGSNVDLIFKVNLSTGDTIIVGHTGLGKQTNCIAFDENLNLFGVIGTASQLNDFISINSTNGAGSVIGSVGMKNILGLAYFNQVSTDVDDENSENIPMNFALQQNYPNPFNPSTKINFSLPVESSVKLIIYNILGQEVVKLADEQMQAGNHSIYWNAENNFGDQIPSGIYLYKLIANGVDGNEFQEVKKMILLK